MLPPNLDFEDRLSLEESVCILTGVKASDVGVFSETDLQGFHVSEVHLQIKGKEMQNGMNKMKRRVYICLPQTCAHSWDGSIHHF